MNDILLLKQRLPGYPDRAGKTRLHKMRRYRAGPAPSRPIERGIAGPGLLARVLSSKYAKHTPLYRQSEIYSRQGVELSRSLLSPLEEAIQHYVVTDTPCR